MLDVPALFNELGASMSAIFGGPYHAGRVVDQIAVEYDTGGDVIPGTGGTLERECQIQIDVADYAMRQSEGFVEGSMRCIILAASLTGGLDADAVVTVDAGPFAGKTWAVSAIERDTLGTHWVGRASDVTPKPVEDED